MIYKSTNTIKSYSRTDYERKFFEWAIIIKYNKITYGKTERCNRFVY